MPNDGLRPRPHQLDALADLTRAFASKDRATLIMACGAGKTLTARWYAEASVSQTTLVLVPSLALLAQTLREWRRGGHAWRFGALVVCSDPSTSAGECERDGDGAPDDDFGPEAALWRRERAHVTTDPAQVATFLARGRTRREAGAAAPQVIFSTYHSLPAVAAGLDQAHHELDLLVCDEAHHLAGRPRESFRIALDPQQLPARRRLFLTATPLTFDRDNPTALTSQISMDDESMFGPVAHTVSFADAISQGLLSDYRVLVIGEVPAESAAGHAELVPASLAHAAHTRQLRRVLTYHGRVSGARAFAATMDGTVLPDGRVVHARIVHGKMPNAERAAALAWLAADAPEQVRVIASVRALSEGVDVPACDAAVFADPRSNAVDVLQAVGRVLRRSDGKDCATIVLPVHLDGTLDDETALGGTAFRVVWAVMRALRAHDQRLAGALDRANADYAASGPRATMRISAVDFALPEWVNAESALLRLVQEGSSGWYRFYGLARRYSDEHAGAPIPLRTVIDGAYLGHWVLRQRQLHAAGLLPHERAALLEQIPGWTFDRGQQMWQTAFDTLAGRVRRDGTAAEDAGPSRFDGLLDAERRPLRRWVARQRLAYRAGELTESQVGLLEQLPGWQWQPSGERDAGMVAALAEFVEWEKHCDVPASFCTDDGLDLGGWILEIRRRKLTGNLHPGLEDEVELVSPRDRKGASTFAWKHAATQWRLAYDALLAFTAREGHARVPGGHVEQFAGTSVGLGQWLAMQRLLRRNGSLPAGQETVLSRVPGFVWDPMQLGDGEAMDLHGHEHGTAHGALAGCPCRPCRTHARQSSRRRATIDRHRGTSDAAAPVLAHVNALLARLGSHPQAARLNSPPGAAAVALAAGVPFGVVKTLRSGSRTALTAEHAAALLGVTEESVLALFDRVDDRGRLAMSAFEKVPADASHALLEDLRGLGWPQTWLMRELGCGASLPTPGALVTRKLESTVRQLHTRVSGRPAPAVARNQRLASLAELESAGRV